MRKEHFIAAGQVIREQVFYFLLFVCVFSLFPLLAYIKVLPLTLLYFALVPLLYAFFLVWFREKIGGGSRPLEQILREAWRHYFPLVGILLLLIAILLVLAMPFGFFLVLWYGTLTIDVLTSPEKPQLFMMLFNFFQLFFLRIFLVFTLPYYISRPSKWLMAAYLGLSEMIRHPAILVILLASALINVGLDNFLAAEISLILKELATNVLDLFLMVYLIRAAETTPREKN